MVIVGIGRLTLLYVPSFHTSLMHGAAVRLKNIMLLPLFSFCQK